ncbi:MAG: zinc ABC transporter substrate-binding protein [bacterium]
MNKWIFWRRYAKGLLMIVMIMTMAACQNENHHTLANSAINKTAPINSDNAGSAEKSAPLLLSTIKPVHLLVSAIAGEQFTLQQLIPDGSSPHHYALRPSDRRAVAEAQVIFRIHPELETFLNPLLAQRTDAQVITLAQASGVVLLPLEASEDTAKDATSHQAHHTQNSQPVAQAHETTKAAPDSDHHHDHATHHQYDLHIWLNPPQTIAISRAITQTLQHIDPENTALYAQRLENLIIAIQQADKDIQAQLANIRQQAYLVQHDAWHGFEHHYQLNKVAAIEGLSGQQAGAASLKQFIQQIKTSNIRCLFNETPVISGQLRTLQHATGIKIAQLDPLGVELAIAPRIAAYTDKMISDQARSAYIQLLKNAANQFQQCLAEP